MLTRIRIEVEGEDSAAATEEALTKYEHALQVAEAQRYGVTSRGDAPGTYETADVAGWKTWGARAAERSFFNGALGREVTDEVIEYDPGLPGYRGRRVVHFKRADTR